MRTNSFLLLIVFFFFPATGCYEGGNKNYLRHDKVFTLKIPEPSGLTIERSGNYLWSVSDDNEKVYRINTEGKTESSFRIDGKDLEGITVVNDTLLAVVLESSNEIVLATTSGNEVSRRKVQIDEGFNKGLEGIAYDEVNKIFYAAKEKDPSQIIILDSDLNEISRKEFNLLKDISGLFYDRVDNLLWILSDEDRKIIIYDPAEDKVIKDYQLFITQPEGIAVDKNKNRLYIVSDKTEKLYVFNLN